LKLFLLICSPNCRVGIAIKLTLSPDADGNVSVVSSNEPDAAVDCQDGSQYEAEPITEPVKYI
jgi:hypothetical protein